MFLLTIHCLFLTVQEGKLSQNNINSDLKKLIELAHQWKIIFNPDTSNQSTEVYLSKKQNQDSTFPL